MRFRPLRLLVASGAGVGAVRTLSARAIGADQVLGDSHDVAETALVRARLLYTGPATKTHPLNGNRAVIRREVGAVQLTIREVSVNAGRRVTIVVRVIVATTVAGVVAGVGR